jgi:glycosyltransferase involved in cell wall biosynthesis
MRLLVLTSEPPLPARSGLPLRVLHLARELAREADLELAAISSVPPPAHEEPFAVTHLPGDWGRLGALSRAAWQPWPVAHIRSRAMAQHAALDGWDRLQAHTLPMMRYAVPGRPCVFDSHDVLSSVTSTLAEAESAASRRAYWRWETVKARRMEGLAVRRAAAVTACTDEDAAVFERLGARRVVVVPNGVDVDAIAHAPPAGGAGVVFVGYFAWRPNAHAALELAHEIMPRIRLQASSANLTLVGAAAPPELHAARGPTVEVTGQVPDVLPYLRRARVTVMPLRAGGGSRLKVLEALAAGIPLVATRFAVTGLGLRHGEHALLVIGDGDLSERLSAAGRRLVEQHYAWTVVARPLLRLHRELSETAHR